MRRIHVADVSFPARLRTQKQQQGDRRRSRGGTVGFGGAEFSGGTVGFGGAEFSASEVGFDSAKFSAREVSFSFGRFSGGMVFFGAAKFSGGTLDFSHAGDWSSPPAFPWTDAALRSEASQGGRSIPGVGLILGPPLRQPRFAARWTPRFRQ